MVIVSAPSIASAQKTEPSLSSMAALVQPGTELRVRDVHSGTTTGRFVRLSPTGIVLKVGRADREIAAADVVFIDKKGDPLWNGAIIGGAIVGFGSAMGAGASCSPDCGAEVTGAALTLGALGASIGLLIDKAWAAHQRIYEAPSSVRPIPPSPDAPAPAAASSFNAISAVVKPNEKIAIMLEDGAVRTGRFLRASADELTVVESGRTTTVPRGEIRSIARLRRYGKKGMWVGGLVGTALGGAKSLQLAGQGTRPRDDSFLRATAAHGRSGGHRV